MGNRFSRRRDVSVGTTETVASQQKSSQEPSTRPAEAAEDSGMKQTPEAVHPEKLEALVEEPGTAEGCSPTHESTIECTEVETPAVTAPVKEPEPETKEAPAPGQPEPLVSARKDPEPTESPRPVIEAKITPELVPEPVPEAESASCLEEVTEADPEPVSEPEPPLEELEQLSQDYLPKSLLSSPLLIDFGVPDVTLSAAPVHVLPAPDEPLNTSAGESTEGSPLEPGKSTKTSEFLEKEIEVEAEESLETLGSDVNIENLNEILKNSEPKGNDLDSDFIPNDVNIPDDTPITDMSTSIEMM